MNLIIEELQKEISELKRRSAQSSVAIESLNKEVETLREEISTLKRRSSQTSVDVEELKAAK